MSSFQVGIGGWISQRCPKHFRTIHRPSSGVAGMCKEWMHCVNFFEKTLLVIFNLTSRTFFFFFYMTYWKLFPLDFLLHICCGMMRYTISLHASSCILNSSFNYSPEKGSGVNVCYIALLYNHWDEQFYLIRVISFSFFSLLYTYTQMFILYWSKL